MLKNRGAISSPYVETWVSLPPSRRPDSWKGIENPVCILNRNLYGHPLAGLYWELFCHDIITKQGFEKVKGWECMFTHPTKQLFLSVYVDDFKLAGPKDELPKMWKQLKDLSLIHISEPTRPY